MANKLPLYCSFCGKSADDVEFIVAGPAVYICDECVDLCVWIVAEHRAKRAERVMQPGDLGMAAQ